MAKTYLQFAGLKLREERLRQGLTQQDVAERVGLSRTQITNIEQGRGVSVTAIVEIATQLGYRVEVDLVPKGGKTPKAVDPVAAVLGPHKRKLISMSNRLASVHKAIGKIVKEIG